MLHKISEDALRVVVMDMQNYPGQAVTTLNQQHYLIFHAGCTGIPAVGKTTDLERNYNSGNQVTSAMPPSVHFPTPGGHREFDERAPAERNAIAEESRCGPLF